RPGPRSAWLTLLSVEWRGRLISAPGQTRDQRDQASRVRWLGNVLLVTGEQGVATIFTARIRGERRGRRAPAAVGMERPHAPNQAIAVFLRHGDVAQDHAGTEIFHACERVG